MTDDLAGHRDAQPHITCPFPLCKGAIEASRTDWTCSNGHYGPNLTAVYVHHPDCMAGAVALATGEGRKIDTRTASEYALPHECLPGGYAGPEVIQHEQLVAPHRFRRGKMTRGREVLCADCRNTRRDHPL